MNAHARGPISADHAPARKRYPGPVQVHLVRVCLGGTFGPFHVGHEGLLQAALEAAGREGSVFVGVVDDGFAQGKRARPVPAFETRAGAVMRWLEAHRGTTEATVSPLADPMGPSATGDYDLIVTSPETAPTVVRINVARTSAGLRPLEHVIVPWVLGEDLLPVNATRIAAGDIDPSGSRLTPVRVAVGSKNPVKVEAIRQAFVRHLPGLVIEMDDVSVPSGVAEQPHGPATIEGATQRASAARQERPDADYAVGLEAGLFPDPTDHTRLLDVQWAAIVDRTGWQTIGHGPGFAYPPRVTAALAAPTATVESIVGEMAGDAAIGRTEGAVGYLTHGRLDRTRLSTMAVEAALVPRSRRGLYEPVA